MSDSFSLWSPPGIGGRRTRIKSWVTATPTTVAVIITNIELREDRTFELREDLTLELRDG